MARTSKKPHSASPNKKGGAKKTLPFSMDKVSSPGRPNGKSAIHIKLAIIKDFAIGIHITYQRRINRSPYAEHILWRATQDSPAWTNDLNLCPDRYFRHVNNVVQKHVETSKYHMRYFFSEMAPPQINETFSQEQFEQEMRDFAQLLTTNINSGLDDDRGNSNNVLVPNDFNELVWSTDSVVSELIGTEGAIRKMKAWLGNDWDGAFEENKKYYRAFFREGNIPKSLQGFLRAPDNEVVDPSA